MYFIDTLKHPFYILKDNIKFPSVSLIHYNKKEAESIYKILLSYFPSFDDKFYIYVNDYIIGQKKYYSFIKIIEEFKYKIAIELKVLSSYAGGGDKSEILLPAIQNYSPSFLTSKIYFFLCFYLIISYQIDGIIISNIKTFRIPEIHNYVIPYTDTKTEPWATSLFDETDFSELLDYFLKKIPYTWKLRFWKKPFLIEKSTLAMNIIDMKQAKKLFASYINFIENISKIEFLEDQNFYKYFEEWEYEKCFSKNGNIHWKLTKIPFLV